MKNFDVRDTQSFQRCINNPEVYKKSVEFQNYLYENDIAWHNNVANECTIDFCCCQGDGDFDTNLPSYYSFAKEILEELFQKIKHGDQEHQDWLENEMKKYLDELCKIL